MLLSENINCKSNISDESKCSVCDEARMNLFSYKQYREKMSDPPGNHSRLTSENSNGIHNTETKNRHSNVTSGSLAMEGGNPITVAHQQEGQI